MSECDKPGALILTFETLQDLASVTSACKRKQCRTYCRSFRTRCVEENSCQVSSSRVPDLPAWKRLGGTRNQKNMMPSTPNQPGR